MTDIIKPFVILNVRDEQDGRKGVSFKAEKVVMTGPSSRRKIGMQMYISIGPNEDVDEQVFAYLRNSRWV